MASSNNNNKQINNNKGVLEGSSANSKTPRGRKPTGKPAPEKKQPQRGLGVAQLERLRLQERWKKMTEIPSPTSSIHSFSQPLESVPVHYGALLGGVGSAATLDHATGYALEHLNHQYPKNLQYNIIPNPNNNPSDIYNNMDHCNNNNISFKKKRLISDNNNGGILMRESDQILQMGTSGLNINNNIPNYYHNNTNIINNNNNNNNVSVGDHLTLGFGTPMKSLPRSSSDFNILQSLDHSQPQGVEIRAVHRRGNNNNIINNIDNNNNIINNNSVVMEYEFFPGLNDTVLSAGTVSKADQLGSSKAVVLSMGGHQNQNQNHHHHHNRNHNHNQEASSSSTLTNYYNNNNNQHFHANNGSGNSSGASTSTTSPTHNNTLDLSLKL